MIEIQVIAQFKRTADGKIVNISVDGPYGKVKEIQQAIEALDWTDWEQQ